MANPTDYYVDPSGGNDTTGDGSIGTPWQTVQHALDNITRDATDGDRINIRDTADDVLSSALSFATYGTPTLDAPCILQGYTTVAGDGGIGGISGNGSVSVINSSALDFVQLFDLHLHNSGSSIVVRLDDQCTMVNVEIDNTSGSGLQIDDSCLIAACYIHNIGTAGLITRNSCYITSCTFENGTNDFSDAVRLTGAANAITDCVFSLDGSSDGIATPSGSPNHSRIINNSIWSNAGTGTGIDIETYNGISILNNIVEGFSGVGGVGISLAASLTLAVYGHNACYNNTTDYSISGDVWLDLGNNETLSASPFIDAANDDFRVKSSVKTLAYPTANYPGLSVRTYLDIGALQAAESGGRMWSATFEEVSVSAAQDLFELVAPSDRNVIIHGCILSQSSSTTSEELSIIVHRGSTSGSGGTTATPRPINVSSGNFSGVVEMNNTSQSTEGNILHAKTFNVLDGFLWYPQPEARPVVSPGERINIELQTAPSGALTMSGTLYFEEMGG